VLSNLKTGLAGTFHAFKFAKYAHRYLAVSSTVSTADSTCGQSWRVWFTSPASPGRASWLRQVANQHTPCLQMIELGAQRLVLQGSSTALEHVTEKFGFFCRQCGQHLALHHIGRSRAGGDCLLPGLR
jgi:hypothetical protein